MDKCQLIDIPSDPEKKREWIKYKLKIQGLSLAALGRKHKTSRQVVSTALYKPSPRWEHEIATALGVKPSEIWPERYDEEHEIPLRQALLQS
ncbi:helix-turn-helix domain-containing protein [Salmonella enterica subsp. enterica serovar Dublin]|nr:helix-turn-helix domain-containing protein [Salmonella enterica subsp. enterica serovar Dublin]